MDILIHDIFTKLCYWQAICKSSTIHIGVRMMTRYSNKHLLALVLPLFLFLCVGCREVSKKALVEDIGIYQGYIDEIHADPYRMISRKDFKLSAEKIKQDVSRSDNNTISIIDCFFILQELSAKIQDGHTRIRLPLSIFSQKKNVFPLRIKFLDDKFYVIENFSHDSTLDYCTLIAINGVPIQALYAKSKHLFNTSLDHVRHLMFEDHFSLILTDYLKIKPPWRVSYEKNSQTMIVELNPMSPDQVTSEQNTHNRRYRHYSIFAENEEIPILDLPNFSYGSQESYQNFIDSFFRKYANANYLIIDLRHNRGGSGYWGFYLLDHFSDEPYRIANKFAFKVSEKMRKSIFSNKADAQLKNARNGEYFEIEKHKFRTPHKTLSKFKGKVFLLISEETFSAGVVVAAVFKANKMGVVIGRETASRVRFCSDSLTLKLPNSGVKVTIPVAVYELPGKNPDRGVFPDIIASRKFDDYRRDRDVEIEIIKEMIQNEIDDIQS